MVHQKIKKSGSTLMGLVVTLVVLIGFFITMFLWLSDNSTQAGVTIDSRYNESYVRVVEQQGELNETVTDIQNKLDDIEESDNIVQVAWNGMQFLGTAILSSKDFIQITTASFSSVTDIAASVGISPSLIILATIGLVAFVVFLVLSNLKGEPRMIN